jgi:2-dehydro-3-deoxyphosphogluconate aldolase/(4S)-4-hydroxy-2-oxoglutarate aldolase
MLTIFDICSSVPIIPVLSIKNVDIAKPIAECLVSNHLRVLEVTLRTENAVDIIKSMSSVTNALVGAGTVLNSDQLKRVIDAGASFAVSPGATDSLVHAALDEKFPLLPGVSSASEIMRMSEYGFDVLKLFPAESVGGINLLKAFAGPFPTVSFCPTGGIGVGNMQEYLALKNVVCVGGTWLVPNELQTMSGLTKVADLANAAFRQANQT